MTKFIFRILLAFLMVMAGVLHFFRHQVFEQIVPAYLPYPQMLVFVSGFFEILGGVGLLIPRISRLAAWGLIALYIAVFPANINMAIHNIAIDGQQFPVGSWVRLPFQVLLIAWAYWFTQDSRVNAADTGPVRQPIDLSNN